MTPFRLLSTAVLYKESS